jgi:hypothetical protein
MRNGSVAELPLTALARGGGDACAFAGQHCPGGRLDSVVTPHDREIAACVDDQALIGYQLGENRSCPNGRPRFSDPTKIELSGDRNGDRRGVAIELD